MKPGDILKSALVAGAICFGAIAASAQSMPNVDILIPTGPGGGWDSTGRTVDRVLKSEGLIGGSSISNVAGAGGTVGLAAFINQHTADPDALLVSGMVMITNVLSNKAPVNLSMVTPVARLTGEYQAIAVPANSPIKTIAEAIDQLKSDPQSVTWVGGSAGGTDHVVAAMVADAVGVDPTKIPYVGYPSGGEIQAAVLSGQATLGVSGLSEFAEHVASGGMRILAVTAPARIAGVDAPTLVESGVNVEVVNWRGLFAAPGISDKERAVLVTLIENMAKTEAWKKELATRKWTDTFLSGDDFGKFVAAEQERIQRILKRLGLL